MDKIMELHKEIAEYIRANWRKSFNEPTGALKDKFIDPAAAYRGQLWDWDSYFCGLSLINVYEDTHEYIKGCVLNFINNQRDDGSIPYMIDVSENKMEALPQLGMKVRDEKSDLNSAKPLLAQMVLCALSGGADKELVAKVYDKLVKHIEHWESSQKKQNGLFVWRSYRGSGSDNHPALFGRPLNSSAGVDLNCFMYMEYLAMAELADLCGNKSDVKLYREKSKVLAELINTKMWDSIDGLYYHLDMLSEKPPLARQEIEWNVPLKFRTWTCFLPLYAGVAPKEYAERMVREHLLNPEEFFSDYGVRTLAKNEPLYSTAETSNPSNWQGPVWVVSTYLIFKGLLNYNYIEEAKAVAENLLSNLAKDIRENGAMHEYYNPETGTSNINLGFMNWNALAGLMVPELLEKCECKER